MVFKRDVFLRHFFDNTCILKFLTLVNGQKRLRQVVHLVMGPDEHAFKPKSVNVF